MGQYPAGTDSYWSEANAASQTEECELFIATQKDHKQRTALRDAPAPRGRMPKGMTARGRMERKLCTMRGRAIYRQRGAAVEPVFGQMKGPAGGRPLQHARPGALPR
ncbi:hypothetical protein [Azospirillum sp. A23]|uniref:hypothetical protein n=1 Tax=Azospirillum sp. A23 TaxID=3160608 RepID=UPI0036F31813